MITKFERKVIAGLTAFLMCLSMVLAVPVSVNAAWNVVRNNATFKAYYDAKRAEGRSHYNALGHCAGKLVRVIWKMLTDEVEFNLE